MQFNNLKVFIPILLLLFFFSFLLSPNFTVAEENECPFAIEASPTEFEVENPKQVGSLPGTLTFGIKDQYKEITESSEITVRSDLEESPNQEPWLKFSRDKITIEKDNDVEVPFYIYPRSLQEGEIYTAKITFISEASYNIPSIDIKLRVLTDPAMEVEPIDSTICLCSVYHHKNISVDDLERNPYQYDLVIRNTETKCSTLNITFDQNQDWLAITPENSSENPIFIQEGQQQQFTVSVDTSKIKDEIKPPVDCHFTISSNDPKNKSWSRDFTLKPTVLELGISIGDETLEKKYTPSIEPMIGDNIPFDKLPMIESGTSYVQLKTILECIDGELMKYQQTDNNSIYRIQFEDKTIILIDNKTGEDSYIIIPESPELDMRLGSVKMLNYEGTTMLSARSIAEIFDMELEWDDSKKITLRKELVHSSHYIKEKSGENI